MNGSNRFREPDLSGIRPRIIPETRPEAHARGEPSKSMIDEMKKELSVENKEKPASSNPFISKKGSFVPSLQELPPKSSQQLSSSFQRAVESRSEAQTNSKQIIPEKQAVNVAQKKEPENFAGLFTKMSKDQTITDQNSKGKQLESRFKDPYSEVRVNPAQSFSSLKRHEPPSNEEPMVKQTVKIIPNPKAKAQKKQQSGQSEQKARKDTNAAKMDQSGYENSILGRVIPKSAFEALVKEVTKEGIGEMKFQRKAYAVIQMGCENFLEREFRAANRITRARGRMTLMPKDMVALSQVVEDLGFKRAVSCPH